MQERWIDFGRTYVTFCTRRDGNYGRFQAEAICDLVDPIRGMRERWVLGALVLAGNVYASAQLPKAPAYTYQLLASSHRHHIFRDYGAVPPRADTEEGNSRLFTDMAITIADRPGLSVNSASQLVNAAQTSQPLVARLEVNLLDGCLAVLQFPLKHLNGCPGLGAWQAETGPVALPASLRPQGARGSGEFDLAYVFFNRLDRCECAVWEPAAGRCDGRTFSRRLAIPAAITVIASADSDARLEASA